MRTTNFEKNKVIFIERKIAQSAEFVKSAPKDIIITYIYNYIYWLLQHVV
jgi:hypothetical protein